ncbi:hypothetical protein [Paludibaculum fermentans]|uniref:hypothetical protein n=1 Tax=Paludibaculum fermentans TaxID=1473598 RepID=UPI003EBD716F
MVLAMGLAILASNKPQTFSWLMYECLSYMPTLALAYGLMRMARYQQAHHRTQPNGTHAAFLLMVLAAMLSVSGFPIAG